jgi:hypothetical protein
MAICFLGFADGELHAPSLEDAAGIAPPGTPACELPAMVAEGSSRTLSSRRPSADRALHATDDKPVSWSTTSALM